MGWGGRLNGLLYIYIIHTGDVLNEYSINDKKTKMNIHKVNTKYICIFKNSTMCTFVQQLKMSEKIKRTNQNQNQNQNQKIKSERKTDQRRWTGTGNFKFREVKNWILPK